MAQSLFDKIGGFAKVSRVVISFYDRILDSEKAGDYFDGIDVSRLVDHQTKFISSLMGGPSSFTDEQLRRAHRHLNIDNESFDEMIQILTETLGDHGLSEPDVKDVMQQMESRRHLIVLQG